MKNAVAKVLKLLLGGPLYFFRVFAIFSKVIVRECACGNGRLFLGLSFAAFVSVLVLTPVVPGHVCFEVKSQLNTYKGAYSYSSWSFFVAWEREIERVCVCICVCERDDMAFEGRIFCLYIEHTGYATRSHAAFWPPDTTSPRFSRRATERLLWSDWGLFPGTQRRNLFESWIAGLGNIRGCLNWSVLWRYLRRWNLKSFWSVDPWIVGIR